MGFLRQQETRLAIHLLAWQYQKTKQPLPSAPELERQANRLVDDAHRIAGERGRNVISIIKELIGDIKQGR